MNRYITAAQADELRRREIPTWPIARQFESGCLGVVRGDDYYIVPDDDPRLANQAPDPRAGA